MSPRPASISQADMNRVLKAARKAGAREVEITAAGMTVKISLDVDSVEKSKVKLAEKRRRLI